MKKAGRPKGSGGCDDRKSLGQIADLLIREPSKTVNAAIMAIARKEKVKDDPEVFRRRLHRKWKAQRTERLHEAELRQAERSESTTAKQAEVGRTIARHFEKPTLPSSFYSATEHLQRTTQHSGLPKGCADLANRMMQAVGMVNAEGSLSDQILAHSRTAAEMASYAEHMLRQADAVTQLQAMEKQILSIQPYQNQLATMLREAEGFQNEVLAASKHLSVAEEAVKAAAPFLR